MNIPDQEDIIRALSDLRESCGKCSCDSEEFDEHSPECGSILDLHLHVTEDDWEILCHDEADDVGEEGHWASATISWDDSDLIIEQAAEQLLIQIEESLADDEVWA